MKVVQNHLKREKNQKKNFPLWAAKTLVKISTVGSPPVRVCSKPGWCAGYPGRSAHPPVNLNQQRIFRLKCRASLAFNIS